MERPIVHLICQAHIDPIWMWAWEEGAREAVSTFRTAADLLEEFPEYVFNHNESLLYEWIEEYDPPLFERIGQLVAAKRWNITGGWYLQPDVNLPAGETLVRVILEGRRYFAEKFNVRPPVAYNFDSFGHPGSLPQLLKQSGFEMYIHFRPTPRQLDLPGVPYQWQGVDGSEVIGLRPHDFWYCTHKAGMAEQQARQGIELARATGHDIFVPWGMGDHGGGATRRDLLFFRDLFAEMQGSDVEIRHSTPEAYLARIRQQFPSLPTHPGELQRTFAGTYTSVAPIKRQMREGEALLASAERWAAIAWWRLGWRYPQEALRDAWKRLMLNTFHDVLCGSLIEDALPGVNDLFGYSHDVARRIRTRAQHAVLPHLPASEGTIPFYVLNPHSTPMQAAISANFLSAYAPPPQRPAYALYDDTGSPVAFQTEGGPAVLSTSNWQPFIGFIADVPALSARRYEIRFEPAVAPVSDRLSVSEDTDGISVKNAWWELRFSRELAAPVALHSAETGSNLLQEPLRLYAMEDVAHAWGGENRARFNIPVSPFEALSPAEVGAFSGVEEQTGASLRIIAQGAVSVTVECLVGWQHTRASLRFTLYADLPYIDVDTRLYMQARRKSIKLVIPFDLPQTRAICEVPYGTAERAADATEHVCSHWVRLEAGACQAGVANNGQNGFDVSPDGVLALSLTRGGIHSSWEGDPGGKPIDTGKSYTFMDQEQIDTRFRILAGKDIAAALVAAALELNQPFERFFAYHIPTAPADQPKEAFLTVTPSSVKLGALKKAETTDALIIRLVETIGTPVTAEVRLENQPAREIAFKPFEIKTFRILRDGSWTETNLIED